MIVSDHNKNFYYGFRTYLDSPYSKSKLGSDEFKVNNDPNQPCIKCDLRYYGCMNTCLIYSRFIRKKLGLPTD